MQNVFHTIKADLQARGIPCDPGFGLWHFLLALPLGDLEQVSYILKQKEGELLETYEDEHALWLANTFVLPERGESTPAMDFDTVKYQLARAVYDMMGGTEQKLADAWRLWLTDTTRGTLQFEGGTEAREYYERTYTLISWLYLPTITNAEWDFLMGNYFIVKALRIGLDVTTLLQTYLNDQFIITRVRHDMIQHWVDLLEHNAITLPTAGKGTEHTVAEWLALARAEVGRQPSEADISKFLSAHAESAELLESDREVLITLIRLYAAFKSGAWDNHPHVVREFSEDIFDLLDKETADNPEILAPLEAPFRKWFQTQVGLRGRQKIVLSLIDRIAIDTHIECLTRLNEWCNTLDTAHTDMDLFYYDETEKKFLWNEELFAKDPTAYQLQPTIFVQPLPSAP